MPLTKATFFVPSRPHPSAALAVLAAAAVACSVLTPTAPAAATASTPPLIVTEILPDNVGGDEFEYFEVHNPGGTAVDLGSGAVGFSYIYADGEDRSQDIALSVPEGTSIDAGETVVFWLSYTTATFDSFARSEAEFREHFAATQPALDYEVVRATGQAGMANGGGRGIRITGPDAELSRSFYPTASTAADRSANFRVPAAGTAAVLLEAGAAPSPGVLPEGTLEPAEPEQPGSQPLEARELLVTEFAPNNDGTDAYEYVEIANTSGRDLDLTDAGVRLVYTGAGDKLLSYPAGAVVPAGGTAVLWLNYSPNTDGLDADAFRGFYGIDPSVLVIPVTGQAGFANTADRGIRIEAGDTVISEAGYTAAQIGHGLGVDYRLPSRSSDTRMAVLAEQAPPTPGTVAADAFVPAPFAPQPDPSLVTAPLQVTELAPDTANVGGADAYEFIEVYNATSEPVDFRDYTIEYLYPLADLTNSSTALWPATKRDAVIPAGGTIVFWIKNGANSALGAEDFNAHFGTALVADEGLFEIESGGLANSAARGVEIVTNTGFTVNRAYYNLGGVDDTVADLPVQYAVDHDELTLQTKLGTAPATPGAVHPEQVDAGLMVVAPDTIAPVVTDRTAAEIDPATDFTVAFTVTDEVQAKTVALAVRSNLDAEPVRYELLASGDGTAYGWTIPAVDLTGKQWFEYELTARDGSNEVTTAPRRVAVAGVDASPVRLNLDDGDWVSGTTEVIAGTDRFPAEVSLHIDGVEVPSTAQLERAPVFAFEASGVDTFFRNGVRIGDDVLHVFDDGIYSGWETISTPVPLSYLADSDELVVGVWAGTKARPEIDPNENNDDFTIRGLRLILPDGRTLAPAGYDDPGKVLAMGDSTGKLDFYDAVFTLPADARSAAGHPWDTTQAADGVHEVRAASPDGADAASVSVDNTAPAIATELEDGKLYQGEFMIDATAEDGGAGLASFAATLDGTAVELPFATSSISLPDGEHTVVFTATDAVGNVAERTVVFTTPVEEPGNELISPADGAVVVEEGEEIALTARAVDPSDDRLTVEFGEASRLEVGDGVAAYTGTVDVADTSDRSGRRAVTAEEAAQLGRFDEVSLAETSGDRFPYQLFEVAVPADAGDDARVRLRWDGSANAEAKVLLHALGADGAWHELDRALTTDGAATSFSLGAVVPVAEYAIGGTVTVLVQHSEGFAGTALSDRSSEIAPNHPEDTPRSQYDFTLAWESDTQYYNEQYHQHQSAIHDYLLRERTDLNLQYLFHTGDIINVYDAMDQWEAADPEYAKLDDAGLPYGVLAGNHDVGHKEIDYTNYGSYFGDDRFAANPWFGGSFENNRGHYDLMSVGGIDFLMLYVGWGAGDAEIAWMNEVLAQYPERIAMLNFHEYMLTTGGLGPVPQRIYDEVVATNPNVRTVFSGHYHDAYTRVDGFDDDGDGVADRQVHQILFDYQGLPEGGLGYLRLLHFDNEGGQIIARTYSPSLDDYNADDPSLELAHQEFTISYADLGIVPREKTLATDAFRAEVLTEHTIGTHEDVASGSELTSSWQPGLGEHGWYVRSVDPFGATADSEVRTLTVVAAGDGGDGDGGDGGDGDGDGDGGDGGAPIEPSVPVSPEELDPALQGAITTVATVRIGDPFTVQLGAANAGQWVQLWLHSTPTALGTWTQAAADGTVRGVIPVGTELGEHTLVAQTVDGVLGWTTLTVADAPTDAPVTDGDGATAGTGDGSLASTGTDAARLAAAGTAAVLLLLAGAVALLLQRRARRSETVLGG